MVEAEAGFFGEGAKNWAESKNAEAEPPHV